MVYRTLNRQIRKITLVFARFFISTATLMFCDFTVITLHIKGAFAAKGTAITVAKVSAVVWSIIINIFVIFCRNIGRKVVHFSIPRF